MEKTQREIIDDLVQLARELIEYEINGFDFLLVRRISHSLWILSNLLLNHAVKENSISRQNRSEAYTQFQNSKHGLALVVFRKRHMAHGTLGSHETGPSGFGINDWLRKGSAISWRVR